MRTKEQMKEYQRLRREKLKGDTPAVPEKPVEPVAVRKAKEAPVAPVPCAECPRLRSEVVRLTAEVDRLRILAESLMNRPEISLPHRPPVDRPIPPKSPGKSKEKETDMEALRKRVLIEKMHRITGR